MPLPPALPAPGSLVWYHARDLLATGDTSVRRLAAQYRQPVEVIKNWIYQTERRAAVRQTRKAFL